MAGKIPKTVVSLVEPAVWSLAAQLLILTTDRPGSKKHQPTVNTFYETGIVTAVYQALLMSPVLAHLEIRHEMPFPSPGKGAPKRVDLWLRPYNGGTPQMIEAGDFGVKKVHDDLQKLRTLNPKGINWFLAFFRSGNSASEPLEELKKSFKRANGLNDREVKFEPDLVKSFSVYRPNKEPEPFGIALLRAK